MMTVIVSVARSGVKRVAKAGGTVELLARGGPLPQPGDGKLVSLVASSRGDLYVTAGTRRGLGGTRQRRRS